MSERNIIVCYEKHGDFFWEADTVEQKQSSALAILTSRWNDGYWYYDPSTSEGQWGHDQARAAELTDEQIAALPTNDLRAQAEKARKAGLQYLRRRKQDQFLYDQIAKAVETKDGQLAWTCLQDRSDHEYERVELEWLRTAENG